MASVHDENHEKNKWPINSFFFRRFWVKEPRRSEIIFAKKKVYLYRSTRRFFVYLGRELVRRAALPWQSAWGEEGVGYIKRTKTLFPFVFSRKKKRKSEVGGTRTHRLHFANYTALPTGPPSHFCHFPEIKRKYEVGEVRIHKRIFC